MYYIVYKYPQCDIILRIGECPSNSPFLKNNGAEAHWSCNLLNIASKLTNEVPFERRKIYLSTDYNIMIMQPLHNLLLCN
jgi:hypothetical protein